MMIINHNLIDYSLFVCYSMMNYFVINLALTRYINLALLQKRYLHVVDLYSSLRRIASKIAFRSVQVISNALN